MKKISGLTFGFLVGVLLASCLPQPTTPAAGSVAQPTPAGTEAASANKNSTLLASSRPLYAPGELVDYVAQTGDTLPAVAAHFNTTVAEILNANAFIPNTATTLPPGMPMKIPIYYAPFWGSAFHILPDSLFVNGPAQVGFDVEAFVAKQPGWLKNYSEYASGVQRSGAQVVLLVAENYSISPRLLLALLEYQSKALTQPDFPAEGTNFVLGYDEILSRGVYLQSVWAANLLNNGYYGWRIGDLVTFEHLDSRVERPDPWQNAATVALQYYFSRTFSADRYAEATGTAGLYAVYTALFGDPAQADQPHIPGSLQQPTLALPFKPGLPWSFTGGPHTGYGDGDPLSALDFAPATDAHGCVTTNEWAAAMAPGIVARSDPATVILDLDGDGDERTGWVIFYFHIATDGRIAAGVQLNTGDPIGHPSCEGGRATGTHVHIARRYNGEWIPAGGPLAFNLEGWIAHVGAEPYQGTLTRYTHTVTACTCSDENSQIRAEK